MSFKRGKKPKTEQPSTLRLIIVDERSKSAK